AAKTALHAPSPANSGSATRHQLFLAPSRDDTRVRPRQTDTIYPPLHAKEYAEQATVHSELRHHFV
ncbi:hypothetical protein BJV74DRAFT_865407, partial [Russula compacta]